MFRSAALLLESLPMLDGSGLSALEARVASELARTAWPAQPWVKAKAGPDGREMLDALVVGCGQGGLTILHALRRAGVSRVLGVDRAPPAGRGPWKTYGRMKTLRSPKIVTGPDLDTPSLTFQSWYEAQFGEDAWDRLGKIPKEMWADYLEWYERVLDLPVEAGTECTAVRPFADRVEVDLVGPEGARTVLARHAVLATGIETPGRWLRPEALGALPEDRVHQAADDMDFSAMAGRVVAVLGAGASAFDNAAAALEAGASAVHVFFRRDEIQRVQPYKHLSYQGFLRHVGDLPDAVRWRAMRHLLTVREAFPIETYERVTRHGNAHLHPGSAWLSARAERDGLEIETAKGPFRCDHAILAVGFDIDLAARPELAAFESGVARWADRFAPPAGEKDARLGVYPYLGPTFELTARDGGDAEAFGRIRVFSFASTMSFGPSGSSLNALKLAAPRLASGITRALFEEDAEAYVDDLIAYDVAEF
ncbi:MAG: NAD(P)/FAD-dependent oxidoreductase [Pseudomonadota bacterium]